MRRRQKSGPFRRKSPPRTRISHPDRRYRKRRVDHVARLDPDEAQVRRLPMVPSSVPVVPQPNSIFLRVGVGTVPGDVPVYRLVGGRHVRPSTGSGVTHSPRDKRPRSRSAPAQQRGRAWNRNRGVGRPEGVMKPPADSPAMIDETVEEIEEMQTHSSSTAAGETLLDELIGSRN